MNLSNLYRYIAIRHLMLKPSRAILTTLGVALGMALYVAIAIINQSTKNSMRENIESISGKAKLSISAGVAGFDESKLEIIRTTKGVKVAVPMIEARAFFEGARESNEGVQILGVDLLQETSVRTYKATDQKIIDDPLTFLNQPDSIVFTKSLAEKHHLTIDSKIKLSTALGLRDFTLRGLLEPEGAARAYGGTLAIMDIDGARVTFGKENKLDRVDIIPASHFEVDEVKKNLERTLGPGFKVERPGDQSEQMEKMLSSYQMVLTFFSSLALLVGLFLVMNSISIAIAERRREIGTLRALGATQHSMVFLFVSEVFLIGLVGSSLGAFLGRILAQLLSKQVTASVAAQFQTRIDIVKLEFTPSQIAAVIVLGTLVSVFAAFFPALKAASVHPLESMKKHAESFSESEEKKSVRLVWVGLALLIFVTLSMLNSWGRIWFGIDLLTKGGSVLGAALFGPFLVFLLLRAFQRVTRSLPLPILKLAQDNLMRSRRRTSANVMALMVGLFLVMLISTVRTSFHDTLTQWLDQIFVADIMVSSSGRMINADVQPMKEEIGLELEKVPGVLSFGPDRGAASKIVQIDHQGVKMAIKALDHYSDIYQYQNFAVQNADRIKTSEQLYDLSEPRAMVTRGFMNHTHTRVGDTFDLETPSGSVKFKIIGEITDFASANGVIYMARENYKKFWKDNLVTAFVLNLAPGYTFAQVKANIDEQLGKKWNLVVISNQEFKSQMQSAIDRSFAYTKAVEWIALLVGLLGLLNTLLISVMERTREIGMLRAIGGTQNQIFRMITIEAILQGFFGSFIAIILGSYVGMLFVEHSLSHSLGWIINFHFPKDSVLTTLLTGVVVAGIAGFFPARHAAHLAISEALDYE